MDDANVGSANNFKAVPFTSVGYNTADIQDIKIKGGTMEIGWAMELFSIWEGVPTVVAGSEFVYCDPSMDPSGTATDYYWGDADGNKVTYSFAAGQGVVINFIGTYTTDPTITTAGEVPTEKVEFTAGASNNFTGNPFPAAIDIQNIKIAGGTMEIGWATEHFSIWEGVPTVVAGSEFVYCDPSMDPAGLATDFYWGDADGNKVTYSIPAGQGVVINFIGTYTTNPTVTINPPYSL